MNNRYSNKEFFSSEESSPFILTEVVIKQDEKAYFMGIEALNQDVLNRISFFLSCLDRIALGRVSKAMHKFVEGTAGYKNIQAMNDLALEYKKNLEEADSKFISSLSDEMVEPRNMAYSSGSLCVMSGLISLLVVGGMVSLLADTGVLALPFGEIVGIGFGSGAATGIIGGIYGGYKTYSDYLFFKETILKTHKERIAPRVSIFLEEKIKEVELKALSNNAEEEIDAEINEKVSLLY